jgi:hypothetical protein
MTKKQQILISFGAMTGGWVLFGFAMTSTFEEPVNTIAIVAGLGFAVIGFISFILALKRQQ